VKRGRVVGTKDSNSRGRVWDRDSTGGRITKRGRDMRRRMGRFKQYLILLYAPHAVLELPVRHDLTLGPPHLHCVQHLSDVAAHLSR
jgi:hypothetical protein